MKPVVFVVPFIVVAAACTIEQAPAPAPSSSTSSSTSSTSSGSSSSSGTTGTTCPSKGDPPNQCGWSGSETACKACITQKCCDQGKACRADCACVTCSESADPASCNGKNAAWDGAIGCLRDRCATECGIASSSGSTGSGSGGSQCGSITCSETPGGNQVCVDNGCGSCFFGHCTLF